MISALGPQWNLLLVADGSRLSSKLRAAFLLCLTAVLIRWLNESIVIKCENCLGRLLSSPFQNAHRAHDQYPTVTSKSICNDYSMAPQIHPS
jgi:hypothetical protein